MGFHGCPIEPSDWSDGPDYDEGDCCPDCDGGRVNREAMTIDGIYFHAIFDQKCETCDGQGFLEPHEPDYLDLY